MRRVTVHWQASSGTKLAQMTMPMSMKGKRAVKKSRQKKVVRSALTHCSGTPSPSKETIETKENNESVKNPLQVWPEAD